METERIPQVSTDGEGAVVRQLRAHVSALEQLLEVHEHTVAEQSERLARAMEELDAYAVELKRSNEELELFAYVASHDLQEPLRMVSSYTQLLGQRYRDKLDDDAREFIDYAMSGAQRMQALINGLLDYSRVATRARPAGAVSVADALKAAVANLTVSISEERAEVVAEGNLPVVSADASQLVQLLQNLIANSLKFRGSEPPRITVSAEREGPMWSIRVSDNGIGIEPRYADRIFLIFQRLHTADEYPGTGMGLAIAKKIVERSGGRIRMESEGLGRGTTFYFTLRAAEER